MAPSPSTSKKRHFAAGFVSGIGSAVFLQPLDLLKTRVQQAGHTSLQSNLASILNSSSGKVEIGALWRGTVPSTLRTGFGSALYFTLLNTLRQQALSVKSLRNSSHSTPHSSNLPVLSNTANLITGASARTLAGLALMPLTIIKVRFESSIYAYRSVLGAARDIYATSGIRGFFSGFGATAIRDGPYAGMYVLFYEALKKQLSHVSVTEGGRRHTEREQRSKVPSAGKEIAPAATAINFSSAVLAGGACSIISNPFDAVKTRIQLEPQQYRNMAHACQKMLSTEGLRCFFDGLALRMTRKALSSAIAWTAYEELIRSRGTKPDNKL